MSDREELSRRLLEENGLTQQEVADESRDGLRSIVESERRRDARVRNLMLVSWAAFMILFVGILGVTYAWHGSSGAETPEVSRAWNMPVAVPYSSAEAWSASSAEADGKIRA